MPTKKVLILGVNGFLGSTMDKYARGLRGPVRVYGLSRRPLPGQRQDTYACDLNDMPRLKRVLGEIRPDIIFHFAGGRFPDEEKMFEANFNTTRNLLEALKGDQTFRPRVVIPGSAAEYGNIPGRKLITENCLPKPLGWYGFVKLLQTDLGLYYARQGLDVIVARMFNICGTHTPAPLAIGGFSRQIVAIERGGPPVIHTKNLEGKRDFLDVQDVCRGLWMIAQKGASGEIYNLCSGRPSSIRVLLRKLLAYTPVKGIAVEENKQDASFSFDVIGSNVKLRSLVDWSPRVSLEHSLRNTLASCREIPGGS